MGARANGVLRESFRKDGRLHDQVLWSLLESDWRRGSNGLWQPSEIQSHDADRTDAVSPISLPTLTH
jgi:hypothetical protein